MIDMKVFGLAMDEDSQVPVLILKDQDEKRALPIWIGAMEAMAISLALNEVKLPRPMTHDLLLNVIREMGSVVRGVDVISLEDGTYYAEIEIELNGEVKRIDSRPSDAIAVALRAEAPIRVSEDVLEQASVDEKSVKQGQKPADSKDKWMEILENFDPSDKYKM